MSEENKEKSAVVDETPKKREAKESKAATQKEVKELKKEVEVLKNALVRLQTQGQTVNVGHVLGPLANNHPYFLPKNSPKLSTEGAHGDPLEWIERKEQASVKKSLVALVNLVGKMAPCGCAKGKKSGVELLKGQLVSLHIHSLTDLRWIPTRMIMNLTSCMELITVGALEALARFAKIDAEHNGQLTFQSTSVGAAR